MIPLVVALVLAFQSTPANPTNDGLSILRHVAQRYSSATSVYLEATVERSTSNELSRNWEKTVMTAIVAPGNKYRYEGRSGYGSGMLVSNGATKWAYHLDEHEYTEKPVSASDPRIILQEEMPAIAAKQLVQRLRTLGLRLNSASVLPDETVELNGRRIECRVVRFTDADLKTKIPEVKTEETIWIDKSRNLVAKIASRGEISLMLDSNGRIPMSEEISTVFQAVRLDEQEPEASFTFSPPADAKLVASFHIPNLEGIPVDRAAEFINKPAPDIRFKNGANQVPLKSYLGKPVFIEFWASWCAPCVDLLPDLKNLYAETASKGLVWISIDSDEEPATAVKLLDQEHVPWANYHDEDGALGRAFGRNGVPLGILVDRSGNVTFYKAGYELSELRGAIAKLGPEFSSVARLGSEPDKPQR